MIKLIINEKSDKGFKWYSNGSNYAKGYAFYNNVFYSDEALLKLFISNDFDINKINGSYCFIKLDKENINVYTDLFNTFPIYYYQIDSNIYISDIVENIMINSNNYEINEEAKSDWVFCGLVLNNETLINNIYNIPFGSILDYNCNNNKLEIVEYKNFRLKENSINTSNKAKIEFDKIILKMVKRMQLALENKKVILFLSGGADSKFCAYLLHKSNIKNVLCVTYGEKNNGESKNAILTAKKYNFEHLFIPYKRKEWKNIFDNEKFNEYVSSVSNYKNTPHTMDFFAIEYLNNNDYVNSNTVFMQGQIGSITLQKKMDATVDSILYNTTKEYFYYYDFKNITFRNINVRLKKNLNRFDYSLENLREFQGLYNGLAYDTYRSFHILRALDSFTFFNNKYYMPMLDYDLLDFFKRCDLDLLYKGKFFKQFVLDITGVFPYSNKNTLICKVKRNFSDSRYSCINVKNIMKHNLNKTILPNIFIRIYRNYRNYLTYISSEVYYSNILKIEKNKNRLRKTDD